MATSDWHHKNITGKGTLGSAGPSGAVGPSGSHHTHGSPGANGPQGPFAIATSDLPTSLLSIKDSNREIMRITADGNVEWYGKPSGAAGVLKRVIENLVDERVRPSIRQRMYANACRSILSRIKDMEKDEIISFLEDSIENRESKAVVLSLREAESSGDERDS